MEKDATVYEPLSVCMQSFTDQSANLTALVGGRQGLLFRYNIEYHSACWYHIHHGLKFDYTDSSRAAIH